MLQVARLAPSLLPDTSDCVVSFLRSQAHPSGGFRNRDGEPDLYYTVFGLEALLAMRAELPAAATIEYLRGCGGGGSLDLVHVACLARCWASMPAGSLDAGLRDRILRRLSKLAGDGASGADRTIYNWFLIAGAFQDLGAPVPDPAALLDAVRALQTPDGGFSNQAGATAGTTPSTAAAVTLLRHFGGGAAPEAARWLRARCHPSGGFLASPATPMPDLLSTATALHALVGAHEPIDDLKEPCLDFLDTLWTSTGGFHGSWADDALDCEYTYYGLLALGHLSL